MRQAALLGMPNCGKSSIYQLLTGRRTATGNRAGVTVAAEAAPLSGAEGHVLLTDLPGIRSAHPVSEDETVTLEYLRSQTPDLLIAVVDATDAARQLPPLCELLRLSHAGTCVMVFNFCDELDRFPNAEELSHCLRLPVYAVSARTGQGIAELSTAIREICIGSDISGKAPPKHSRRPAARQTAPCHTCTIQQHCPAKSHPFRFGRKHKQKSGMFLTEARNADTLRSAGSTTETAPSVSPTQPDPAHRGASPSAARCSKAVPERSPACRIQSKQIAAALPLLGSVSARRQRRSERLDRLFLRPLYGFPLFFTMMAGMLWLTFGPPGEALTSLFCDLILSPLSNRLLRLCTSAPAWLASLLRNGVLGGVGAVLSFLPRLALLFLFQAGMEQSGLLSRINRLFDPIFRKFGLRGDAVTPMLLGFGCSVPAILCTRAMKDCASRERCACFLPVVACSARMPLCMLIADCFFPGAGWILCALIWLLSGLCFLLFCALAAKWGKKTALPDQHTDPLPRWRLPDWRELVGAVWAEVLHFLTRAGGMIFLFSVLIWLLSGFRPGVPGPVPAQESLLAMIGTWLALLLSPLGLGDWRIASALLAGIGAKEAAISTLGVLLGGEESLPAILSASGILTPASAVSLLIFYTLYFPCVATVSTLRRRERRWLWLPPVFAYLLAAAVFQTVSRI